MFDQISPRSHQGLSILIVDDNKFTRDLLRKILVAFEMTDVVSVESGEDALRTLSASYFDLVICDIVMDGMSGIQLVKSIRCQTATANHIANHTAHIPVIMLTAHADERIVQASMKAGANGYLVKPLIPARLMPLIAKLCHSTVPTLHFCGEPSEHRAAS